MLLLGLEGEEFAASQDQNIDFGVAVSAKCSRTLKETVSAPSKLLSDRSSLHGIDLPRSTLSGLF